MRIAALVLAAGSSRRFGGQPKQFEDLGGVTVLERAVRVFAGHPAISEVWVVASEAHLDRTREVLSGVTLAGVVVGGAERADSTRRGLDALGDDITHVLVHDAARPLVPARVVDGCIAAFADSDVVATVLEPRDSILIVDAAGMRPLERSAVRLHQTPQGFTRSLLARACELGGPGSTDDVSAVLTAFPEETVSLVEGDRHSLKITDADDLIAVRAFLAERR